MAQRMEKIPAKTKIGQKERGDDDGNFQRAARGQAAFGDVDGQQQQQDLAGDEDGEPEPVAPVANNIRSTSCKPISLSFLPQLPKATSATGTVRRISASA